MNEDESRLQTVFYWWDRAESSLEAALREMAAGDLSLAINRLYYACFYAVSAVLLQRGFTFTKHSAVKAMFHRQLVNAGLVDRKWAGHYTGLFENRHEADYLPFTSFKPAFVESQIEETKNFLTDLSYLLPPRNDEGRE